MPEMNQDEAARIDEMARNRDEIIICGRLPKRARGEIDLYKVDRFLKQLTDTPDRIAVLRRLVEHLPRT